ncbi:hypothetical protein [Kribbella deserti]|uniref:Nuclear transport factor 2 family protein n=1 Tax=Kribbella deserti TaxID=1926257 RepID=A0ABV6QT94_9ACTN
MLRRVRGMALLAGLVLLVAGGCGSGPSKADTEAVQSVLTQYLKDRATRVTDEGTAMNGKPLTTAPLDPDFAVGVQSHARKLDERRAANSHTRAEVDVVLKSLEITDELAKATVVDNTKLYLPSGGATAEAGGSKQDFSLNRGFTLKREGGQWVITGTWLDEPPNKKLPITEVGG